MNSDINWYAKCEYRYCPVAINLDWTKLAFTFLQQDAYGKQIKALTVIDNT